MFKNIFLYFKFYIELDYFGREKKPISDIKDMHISILLIASLYSFMLGTMVFVTSLKDFEFKIIFTIGTFLFLYFYLYFATFLSNYIRHNYPN